MCQLIESKDVDVAEGNLKLHEVLLAYILSDFHRWHETKTFPVEYIPAGFPFENIFSMVA